MIFHLGKCLVAGMLLGGISASAANGIFPHGVFSHQSGVHSPEKAELQKLLFLLKDNQRKNLDVVYNGRTYPLDSTVAQARAFLAAHYNGENAETWIKSHLYRSRGQGEIIYVRMPNGNKRPLRDFLIDQLPRTPQAP